MSKVAKEFLDSLNVEPQEALNMVGRLFDVAKPNAVYTEPIVAGENTIITASEVAVVMGAGFGGGAGFGDEDIEQAPDGETIVTADSGGGGIGGGGGGFSHARPVAAIIVNDDGVRVEPIVDPTKIGIAFLTTLAAMVITLLQLQKLRGRNLS